jgi:hypothetical protein
MTTCPKCKQQVETPFPSITGAKICHNCRMDEIYGHNNWNADYAAPIDPLDAAIARLKRDPLEDLLHRRRELYKNEQGR